MNSHVAVSLAALLVAGCTEQGLSVTNRTPEAQILAPSAGDLLLEGAAITLEGTVNDPDGTNESLWVTWTMGGEKTCEGPPEADGTTRCENVVSLGDERIRLDVRDAGDATGTDSIKVVIQETSSPTAELLTPVADGNYYSDQLITFEGAVSDPDQPPDELDVWWESSRDGDLQLTADANADGRVIDFGYLTEGEHAVTLHVQDNVGKSHSDSVIIDVGPPNSAPECGITAPVSGTAGEEGENVTFEAWVSDADLPANQLQIDWSSDKDGPLGTSVATSDGDVVFNTSSLSPNAHTITLTVTDEVGEPCTALTVYIVGSPPTVLVTEPTDGALLPDSQPVTFRATVVDNEDSPSDVQLEWHSSIDDVFSTVSADSSGAVQFAQDGLSLGIHSITVTATDSDGLFSTDLISVTIYENLPPVVDSVVLTPDPAYEGDTLQCIAGVVSDPNGDDVTLSYAWSIGGGPISETSDTLGSDAFARGDVVVCTVTPDDGSLDGAPVASNPVTIGNSAPRFTGVSIAPDPPQTADTLSAATEGWSDADDDAEDYEYAWTVNGAPVGIGATLDGSHFIKGDTVEVTLTAFDGIDTGNTLSAEELVVNTPPEAPVVSIDPPDPVGFVDDLLCVVDADSWDADEDGVDYTFEWTVNGAPYSGAVATFETGDTVPAADTVGDETWVCTVTPDDGEDEGPAGTASTDVACVPPFTTGLLACTDYRFVGVSSHDHAGWRVSSGGDVDGDGLSDIFVGARNLDDGATDAGGVYLVFGGSLAGLGIGNTELSVADYSWSGENDFDQAGHAVAAAGDVDSDGLGDLLVGAWQNGDGGFQAGKTYLILGSDLGIARDLSLSTAAYAFLGEINLNHAGEAVAGAGDVDGDNRDDILIGASANDDGGIHAGKAYLVLGGSLGAPGATDLSAASASFVGETDQDNAGAAVSTAGDVDGDGLHDLLIGAHGSDEAAGDAGQAYLVLGESIALGELDLSAADYGLTGEATGDFAGNAVSTAGDVDDDGLDDILVGAWWHDAGGNNAGKVYLMLGSTLASAPADISLADADYAFVGESANDHAGVSLAAAGSVDGDHLDDVLIGAHQNDENGFDAGKVYLVLGDTLGLGGEWDLSSVAWSFLGEQTEDFAGHAVAGAGDVDGGGYDDLLVGAYGNPDAGPFAGKAYLVLGQEL